MKISLIQPGRNNLKYLKWSYKSIRKNQGKHEVQICVADDHSTDGTWKWCQKMMRKDPNLIKHVRGYFEGGGQTPTNMKEKLKLDEDFVFDADEAMSTPDSDSAKVLTATVDNIVQKRLSESMNQQKAINQQAAQEHNFKDKHNMNDSQWTEFVDFAKNRQLTLEDIYYLKNREHRENNIANNAREQVAGQMKKVQEKPPSIATQGSSQVDTSQEDKVFNAMLGIDRELESAFG